MPTREKKGREQRSPVQVQKFLRGVDYPASKEQLIESAQEEGADEQTLELLGSLPDRQYESPISVSQDLGQRL